MTRRARRRTIVPQPDHLEDRRLLSLADPTTSLLVRFQDSATAARQSALLGALHGRVVQQYPDGPELVAFGSTMEREAALARLSSSPLVKYAEANGTLHVDALPVNDPGFSLEWGMTNPNDVDVDAQEAWMYTTGNPQTTVAVIDTGIDQLHPDLASRLWSNPAEVPGNAYDDDHDGYADDTHGWNFIDDSPNIQDDNGHGSHVAGVIGALGNNNYGVAGVDWNARLMVLKFMDAQGNGSIDDAVRAIYYAVQHGARVINASWGGGDQDPSLTNAIAYAGAHNVVFVTAAGNDGVDNARFKNYPADNRLPNVISVAAVDQLGNLANFSNYGATTVDLAAPGVGIRSTVPGGFDTYSGTSMATPFVTGVVSLVAGLHPEFTAQQLVQRVLATVKPLPSLQGLTVTGGMVDAYRAVLDIEANPTGTPPANTVTIKHKKTKKVVKKPKKVVKKPKKAVKKKSKPQAHAKALMATQPATLVLRAAHPGGPLAPVAAWRMIDQVQESPEGEEFESAPPIEDDSHDED